jgi:hypothetical protein
MPKAICVGVTFYYTVGCPLQDLPKGIGDDRPKSQFLSFTSVTNQLTHPLSEGFETETIVGGDE